VRALHVLYRFPTESSSLHCTSETLNDSHSLPEILATNFTFSFVCRQRLQRDLTVEVLRQFVTEKDGGITVLDALAGCGVRAIRYALEVPSVQLVVANDLKPSAAEALQQNVDASLSVAGATSCQIQVRCGDAGKLLRTSPAAFDVVEVDPCGSPAPFLAAAVRAVKDGGLLCLACTDYQDLVAKHNGEAAQRSFARYSGWVGTSDVTISAFATETAIRIVLHSIELASGAQGRRVEVILCTALDFYLRIIVRIVKDEQSLRKPPILVSKLRSGNGQFTGDYRSLQFGHVVDGGTFLRGSELLGPMWSDAICELPFLECMQQRLLRNHGGQSLSNQNVQTIFGNPSHSWFIHKDASNGTNEYFSPLNSGDERDSSLLRLRDQCMQIGRARAVDLERESVRQVITQLIEEASVGSNRNFTSILFPFSIREVCSVLSTSSDSPSSQVLQLMTHLFAQGFEVSRCHSDLLSVKTTASYEDIRAALRTGHQSASTIMVPSVHGDLAGARIRNSAATSLNETHSFTDMAQKKQKVQHPSEFNLEELSAHNGCIGLIDGEDLSKIGANRVSRNYRTPGGRIITVDKLIPADVDKLCFGTLGEAMRFIQPHDKVILSCGRHETLPGGLVLRVPDLHISGEIDSCICLPEDSGKSRAKSEFASTGSTVTVLAARITITGTTIEATPNVVHQAMKHGDKSEGAPSWSSLAVEGLGNSAVLRNCHVSVKRSIVGKSKEPGIGKGRGTGAYSKGGCNIQNIKGAGIVVASRSSLTMWNVSFDQEDYSAGFDIGVLTCGRADSSIFDSVIRNTASCGLLTQSGGIIP